MARTGRPSSYTPAIAAEICEVIATTDKSLRAICARANMPSTSTVCKWLTLHSEFAEQYARARESQGDLMAAQTVEIADASKPANAAKTRIQVDARKWLASKLAPKKYGDRIELAGDKDNPITSSLTIEFVKAPELGAAVVKRITEGGQ